MAAKTDSLIIVVSGANRGIGLELTRQAVERGHQVIAGARHPSESRHLRELESSARGKLQVFELDITSQKSVDEFVARLSRDAGVNHVDLLINNAGVLSDDDGRTSEVAPDLVRWTLDTNAVGTVRMTQAMLPLLRHAKHACVANTSSLMGSISDNGSGGSLAYRMSKAAVNMFTKTLANEERGMTVVSLHPGWVKTDMGGPSAPVEPSTSAEGILNVLLSIKPAQTGRFFNYDGRELHW